MPDPLNPPQLKPVWGTAEVLELIISTVDGNGATQQLQQTYKVKPEPGKPDHFVSTSKLLGGPVDPVFSWWADGWVLGLPGQYQYVPAPLFILNTYLLGDQYENLTFGYTNTAITGTSPSSAVSLTFAGQLTGLPDGSVDADANGYLLSFIWNNNPTMPQGTYTASMSVTYPADPEWSGGTVNGTVHMEFVRADASTPIRYLATENGADYDGYYCFSSGQMGAYEPVFPIAVSPGAFGEALPKVEPPQVPDPQYAIDSPARLVFAIKKRYLPDPSPCVPATNGTSCDTGDEDAWVELADNPAFRVSLVDAHGTVVPDAEFQIHLCPLCLHFKNMFPDGSICDLLPVVSQSGVVESVRLNQNGFGSPNSQGYLAAELLRAPSYPGTYYLRIETLEGKQYRVREVSDLHTDSSPTGEYQGAFAFCLVTGVEFLNSDFQSILDIGVATPEVVYVRYVDPVLTSTTTTADLTATDSQSNIISTLSGVVLTRVGASSVFLSPSITINPPAGAIGPSGMHPASTTVITNLDLKAASGVGYLTALPANQPLYTKITTLTDLQFDFQVGANGNGPSSSTEPNLLFANGADYTDMSVRITYADGQPLAPTFGVVTYIDQGALSGVSANPDSDGRISFRYTAPSLPKGQDAPFRPTFGFTLTFPDGVTTQVTPPQTARPPLNCGRRTDLVPDSHCFETKLSDRLLEL